MYSQNEYESVHQTAKNSRDYVFIHTEQWKKTTFFSLSKRKLVLISMVYFRFANTLLFFCHIHFLFILLLSVEFDLHNGIFSYSINFTICSNICYHVIILAQSILQITFQFSILKHVTMVEINNKATKKTITISDYRYRLVLLFPLNHYEIR